MNFYRYCKALVLILLAILTFSCATTLHELDRGEQPEQGRAYIFGRFHQPNAVVNLKLIVFNIDTEKKYSIPIFGNDIFKGSSDYVKVIPLEPGLYHIIRIDAEFSSYSFKSKKRVSSNTTAPIRDARYLRPFTIKAGQLGYIGDVTGSSGRRGITSARFGVKIYDRYDRDIKELEKRYPGFMSLEVTELF